MKTCRISYENARRRPTGVCNLLISLIFTELCIPDEIEYIALLSHNVKADSDVPIWYVKKEVRIAISTGYGIERGQRWG